MSKQGIMHMLPIIISMVLTLALNIVTSPF